jgi:hypothetical protein
MTSRFTFLTNCVNCPGADAGEAINAMKGAARIITRRTFAKHVDLKQLQELEKSLGYDHDLPMWKDWHVGYAKSVFRGKPCYYFTYSRIEFIFTAPTTT